jgi:DNA (cytosine-5)-methyltransferase 1
MLVWRGSEYLKLDRPLRLIELFAGYGSQALALNYLNIPFEHHFVCEFDKYAMQSYNEIHNTDFKVSDIRNISADDLNITETDKYKYLMTYSFPCTDLSVCGNKKGMVKNSNTSSSLLWEVERLLSECSELPQYLMMENVSQVISDVNIQFFKEWCQSLCRFGYANYYKVLNASDFGIPQNRERLIMISILKSENISYKFPEPLKDFKVVSDIFVGVNEIPYKLILNQINFPHLDKIIKPVQPYYEGRHNFIVKYSDIKCVTKQFRCNTAIFYDNGIVSTLMAKNCVESTAGHIIKVYDSRIKCARGLTPKEHFRLMGVKDEDYAKLTCSDRQKYKQAGNSIVVNVLMAVFENLFIKDCEENRLF